MAQKGWQIKVPLDEEDRFENAAELGGVFDRMVRHRSDTFNE
jgi:hypothetical protein